MIKRFFIEPPTPFTWLLALLLVLVMSVAAGLSVGWISGSRSATPLAGTAPRQSNRAAAEIEEAPLNPDAPPLALYASPLSVEEWNVFLGEVGLAAAQGIHRFIVPLRLTWRDPWDSEALIEQLNAVVARDPEAMFTLEVDMNPTAEWLRSHEEAAVKMEGQTALFASPSSQPWHTYAVQETFHRVQALMDSPLGRRIYGCWLSAMFEGSWRFEPGYDTSLASQAAFEKWTVTRYGSPEAAAAAWKMPALPRPITPDYPDTTNSQKVFFNPATQQRNIDYLRFVSESTGDTLARIAAEFRERFGPEMELFARYGFGLEIEHNSAGHFALSMLLNSELDGFITPVSYASRGSGGTGAPMAAIHSAKAHGKVWYLLG